MCRSQWHRLRTDGYYRNTVAQALLRGLLNAASRGPRATVLWALTLPIEVALEVLRALQHNGPSPFGHGADFGGPEDFGDPGDFSDPVYG